MKDKNLMKNIQSQKILQTIQIICRFHVKKQQLFKKHIPIHQTIIKKAQLKSNETILLIQKLSQFIKDEKQMQVYIYQKCQKSTLWNMAKQRKNKSNKQSKDIKINQSQHIWNKNLIRLQQAMENNQIQRANKIKTFYQSLQNIEKYIKNQENRYHQEIKKNIKQLNRLFDLIDNIQSYQTNSIKKMIKDSKNLEKNDSIIFLTQFKKLQRYFIQEIKSISERGLEILKFLKTILTNEKQLAKNIKEYMSTFIQYKKQLQCAQDGDQKIVGLINFLQDEVQENCQKCFDNLLQEQQLTTINTITENNKSNLAKIIAYLKSGVQGYNKCLDLEETMIQISTCMTFKNWGNVSLATGWFITTFTPCHMFLTYDHYIGIFDLQGNLLKKIKSTSTKIDKIGQDDNIVYLVQIIKGFFSDSKQEYKIKFQDLNRLEEFELFIQNQL